MTSRALPFPLLIVPGLGGSGPGHWQSRWAEQFADAERVAQLDWDRPDLAQWLYQLRASVARKPGAILVGHSLGCILISHLAQRFPNADIAGALMVAPADVEACANLPECIADFVPIPRAPLPFPSTLIASTDDPYMTLGRAREIAEAWGSRLVDVGASGHINIAAGFGPWPEGERHLESLCATAQSAAGAIRPLVQTTRNRSHSARLSGEALSQTVKEWS
jgi:uncharacterized protein